MERCFIIDADDTLWYDHIYFARLRSSLVEILTRALPTTDGLAEEVNRRLSSSLPGEFGFHKAVLDVGDGFLQNNEALAEVHVALDVFLSHPIEVFPGVVSFLENTQGQKFLYTKGIAEEQRAKIERSGLEKYFSAICVVEQKSVQALSRFISEKELDPSAVFYIGNSLKHDMMPALTLGCAPIWFDHPENSFGRNQSVPDGIVLGTSWSEVARIVNGTVFRPRTVDP